MPWWGILIIFFSAFLVFATVHYISKSKHPFKRALLSMAIGLCSLLIVNLISDFTGVYIPVSLLSILTSTIGGVPGTTLLLALNLFF